MTYNNLRAFGARGLWGASGQLPILPQLHSEALAVCPFHIRREKTNQS